MNLSKLFFCKNKPYKNNEAEVYKKEERIRTFWGWEVQKQKIKVTMIYISFKRLLTKEWATLSKSSFGI